MIPAYKGLYLDAALASLAGQTNKGFRVIVGDDCSPDDIESICARYAGQLDLQYTRFPDRLGGRDLVGQWMRCISLGSSPWVWLFSDDDLADRDCVEAFYRTRDTNTSTAVFRFQTRVIDGDGECIRLSPPHPDAETAAEFLYHRVRGVRDSFAAEYVFRRSRLEELGGFQRFPSAWGSDDATWATMAASSEIRSIPGACVGWRESAINLSARTAGTLHKVLAIAQWAIWLRKSEFFDHPRLRTIPARQRDAEVEEWVRRSLLTLPSLSPIMTLRCYALLRGSIRAGIMAAMRFHLR